MSESNKDPLTRLKDLPTPAPDAAAKRATLAAVRQMAEDRAPAGALSSAI